MRPFTVRRSVIAVLALAGSVVPTSAVLADTPPPPPPPGPGDSSTTSAGYFHPLDPARILDTREGLGARRAAGPAESISLRVAGRGGVPVGAGAVVLNVTAVQPTSQGYVTVHPTGSDRPTASNLNFTPGKVVPNLVIAKLGDDGKVDLFNSRGTTHLVADVMGWYDDLLTSFPEVPAGGSRQRGITPTRLLDTRELGRAVGPDSSIELRVAGVRGIPVGATAVVLNVTAVQPSAQGYVTVHPHGTTRPTASNLNFRPGQTVPNLVIAKVGRDGKVRLYNRHGSTHLVVDATAYFEPTTQLLGGGELNAATPARVLDTRIGQGAPRRKVRPGETISVDVTGVAEVPPTNVDSVVLNVTVTEATSRGYVTVHPSDGRRPTASNLNFTPGLTVPNLVIVKVGNDGHVKLYNSSGETHLIADVAGWVNADGFTPAPPPGPGGPLGGSTGDAAVSEGTATASDPHFATRQQAFWAVNDPQEILARSTPEPLLDREGTATDATYWSGETEYQIWSQGYTYPDYDDKIGRLLYWVPAHGQTPGHWNYCTATMVARNLAITAAHCVVNARSGLEHSHFAFFAGLSGTTANGGIHTNVVDTIYPTLSGRAAFLDASYGWAADYAFVKFGATNGTYPGDRLGWYGIKLNPDLNWLLSLGYAAEGSYFERYCTSAPQTQLDARCYLYHTWGRYGGWHRFESGWYEIGWGSDMSGGASGGPVFAYEDGAYRIVSVNSNGQTEVCDLWRGTDCAKRRHVFNMWGPYFTDFLLQMHANHRA